MMSSAPRIGGLLGTPGSKQVSWTGGGLHAGNKLTAPRTTFGTRPTFLDLRSQQNIEYACTTPLEESLRLEMYPAKKGPAFTHWLTLVDRHAKKTGLDACFFVLLKNAGEPSLSLTDPAKTSELYLLSSFGQISLEQIQCFNEAIMASSCSIDQLNN